MLIFLIKLFCVFFFFFIFNKFIYLEKFSLQKINLYSISFFIKLLFILIFFFLFQLIKELIFYQLNFELISFLTSNSIKIWYKIFNIFSDFNTTLIIWILLSFSFFEVINNHKINIKLMYIEKYKSFSFFINIYILLIYLFITSIIFHYNKQIFIQFKINMLLYNLILLIHPILIYLSYTYIIYILSKILFCFRQNFLIQEVVLFKNIENQKKFKILSFSIILGGIWAYTQLGWGGFWFWDPIENISLILWLILIIFFHAKDYNFLKLSKKFIYIFFFFFLIIYLFLITRSGFLTSVHSFVVNKNFFLLCIIFYIVFYCYYIFILYNINKIYFITKTKLNINLLSTLIYIFLIFNLFFISNISKYNILFFFFVNIIVIYYLYILYKKENISKIYEDISQFHFKIFFFGILLYFISLKKKTVFLTFFTDTNYILLKNMIIFLDFKFLQKSDIYIQEIKNYFLNFNGIFYNFEFKKTINFNSTENIKLNIEILFNFISNIYINFVEFLNLNILKFEIKEFICCLIYIFFFIIFNKKKKKYGIIE